MEYGLWRRRHCQGDQTSFVLILVLMEYGLWRDPEGVNPDGVVWVLILVLMEYGLWRHGELDKTCGIQS